MHAVVARSTFPSQNVQSTPRRSEHFWKLRCWKSVRCCGAKHISKSKCERHYVLGPLLDVQMSFRVAGARDCGPCQKWAEREGFVAFQKTMAGVGHLKGIWKGEVQETCSSELLGGPGADFLGGVAFWSLQFSVCWDDFFQLLPRPSTIPICLPELVFQLSLSAFHLSPVVSQLSFRCCFPLVT